MLHVCDVINIFYKQCCLAALRSSWCRDQKYGLWCQKRWKICRLQHMWLWASNLHSVCVVVTSTKPGWYQHLLYFGLLWRLREIQVECLIWGLAFTKHSINVCTVVIIWKENRLDLEKMSLDLLRKFEMRVRTCIFILTIKHKHFIFPNIFLNPCIYLVSLYYFFLLCFLRFWKSSKIYSYCL